MNNRTTMNDILWQMAHANTKTPVEYLSPFSTGVKWASLFDKKHVLDFTWKQHEDKVCLNYVTAERSQIGESWIMTKPEARKLWDELIWAGFEWR
jgi:hypothetical protein